MVYCQKNFNEMKHNVTTNLTPPIVPPVVVSFSPQALFLPSCALAQVLSKYTTGLPSLRLHLILLK